jgi:hypothetical protein
MSHEMTAAQQEEELIMLGSEHTVSRVPRTIRRPLSQNWLTFLRNHLREIVSADFFTGPHSPLPDFVPVPGAGPSSPGRTALPRHRTPHIGLGCTSNDETFGDRGVPRYLIRDREGVYGSGVRAPLISITFEEGLTAPQSPWQNGYAQRLIEPIRRECLNHFVILNVQHLKRTLRTYFRYYH